MSTSRDIESLFKRFGGDAGRYQEVRAEADADAARARWPLLDGVELREHAPQPQPHSAPPDNGHGLRNIVTTDTRAAVPPDADADRRDQTSAPLKKLVGRQVAPHGTGAQGPAQPLVRVFERLRTAPTGDRQDLPPTWKGRS
ncbi:cellulose biosynthesis protein BcsP [Burkholderia sp. IMCC1007]|uniref:cellulose biosynthesis protein BcsP n=1 Tax=Burkholderia sp. IMCC1007 TaxID=3004104 RepID=UPI0022B398D5|nr:cellulose biosynthesis protein BcsP [Burkholderia sp. IMCC1007]